MSTFDGIVDEFPDIRIDYFRQHPSRSPPAACFLSHVHSDHLLGLEILRMPFVYCSAATRKLLLQMEKYPHRVNFSKGILESRKQTYKHLKFVLRALPLQTPTELELTPKLRIKVTLFDANHCPGAVMFLIEGDGHAILYTGDIRAESWWVNSLVRNPVLIPFAAGLKRLDCLYLDTTFASHQDIHHEFPSKAQGLAELIRKVKSCPDNSIFYFRAWTLGYEDVWITLQSLLDSQIHVDRYQVQLFSSIAQDGTGIDAGPALVGFTVGNQYHPGCLTQDGHTMIHSCEPGLPCHRALSKRSDVVWITPIISRLKDGTEVAEVGAGGGGRDFFQNMEVDCGNQSLIEGLRLLCSSVANDPETAKQVEAALKKTHEQKLSRLTLNGLGLDPGQEITIKDFVKILLEKDNIIPPQLPYIFEPEGKTTKVIHFPYSRHSSYSELRELTGAFRPRDICPCTVSIESWSEELSMQSLFGDLCSSKNFRYDEIIRQEVCLREESLTTASQGWISQRQIDTQMAVPYEQSPTRSSSPLMDGPEDAMNGTTVETELQPTIAESSPHDGLDRYADSSKVVDDGQIQYVWRVTNRGADTYQLSVDKATQTRSETSSVEKQEISLNPSTQALKRENPEHQQEGRDNFHEDYHAPKGEYQTNKIIRGSNKRRKAFEAAKACLDGEQADWIGLNLRSLGWKGHTEEELEL